MHKGDNSHIKGSLSRMQQLSPFQTPQFFVISWIKHFFFKLLVSLHCTYSWGGKIMLQSFYVPLKAFRMQADFLAPLLKNVSGDSLNTFYKTFTRLCTRNSSKLKWRKKNNLQAFLPDGCLFINPNPFALTSEWAATVCPLSWCFSVQSVGELVVKVPASESVSGAYPENNFFSCDFSAMNKNQHPIQCRENLPVQTGMKNHSPLKNYLNPYVR